MAHSDVESHPRAANAHHGPDGHTHVERHPRRAHHGHLAALIPLVYQFLRLDLLVAILHHRGAPDLLRLGARK